MACVVLLRMICLLWRLSGLMSEFTVPGLKHGTGFPGNKVIDLFRAPASRWSINGIHAAGDGRSRWMAWSIHERPLR
jgi:hypothetical protein